MTPDLSLVTHTQGTGIFFPLFTMLVYLASCRAGSRRTLRAALPRNADDNFILVTKQRLTLSCKALGEPISAYTLGTVAQVPILSILKHVAVVGTGFPSAHTDRAAVSFSKEFQPLGST